MKKIATLVLLVAVVFSTNAQRGKRGLKKMHDKLTTAQKATLAIKKMTLSLDLTAKQQRAIKPLLFKQIAERKAMHNKVKALKKADKKPTVEEFYTMQNKRLDKQIAFKSEMKKILNEEQYQRFEKMHARKKQQLKKMAVKRMQKNKGNYRRG